MPSSENPHTTSRSAQSLLDKQLPDIDPSLLSVQTVATPKSLPDLAELKFGSTFTGMSKTEASALRRVLELLANWDERSHAFH
jgi:hypothetical protein